MSAANGRPSSLASSPSLAYFTSGDGELLLARGGAIRFRDANGAYIPAAVRRLNQLFGAPGNRADHQMEMRLFEALDAIQDHFGAHALQLVSGYRSRTLNNNLRHHKRLAAQSSMHIEGGAADFTLGGVSSAAVAEYARSLNCCGVGFYHGHALHLDAGPVRFWDEKTSGTEDTTPQRNEKIMLSTDADRYRNGAAVALRIMRATEYPLQVRDTLRVECQTTAGDWRATDATSNSAAAADHCTIVTDALQARTSVHWTATVPTSCRNSNNHVRLRVVATFCHRTSERMPDHVVSNEFEIVSTE